MIYQVLKTMCEKTMKYLDILNNNISFQKLENMSMWALKTSEIGIKI